MQHIGKALEKLIKSTELGSVLDQQKAMDVWQEIVGEHISKNTETVSIQRGTLKIKVISAVWRQELQLQKKTIIEKLNKKLNKNIIKDIRFL